MVFFTCNTCGSSLKKNQVEKHYQCECPRCEVLSCMDCGKDFYGDEYAAHTKCISEAEKYQSSLFRENGKEGGVGKGEKKQQEWVERVQELVTKSTKVNPRIVRLLERVAQYPNIPRKKSKFENFVKNSINVRDQQTLGELWELFSTAIKPAAVNAEEDTSVMEATADGVSEITCVPTTSLPEKEREKKFIKEHEATSDAAAASEIVELKIKKKKKKCKIRKEISESKNAVAEEGLGTSAQAAEETVVTRETKKKKKRKHETGPSLFNDTAEESVPSVNITTEGETCGRSECEISAELEPPKKKKRKKPKKREAVAEDVVVCTEDGADSVEPMEVAREYINGCQALEGAEGASSAVREREKKTLKKGRKKRDDSKSTTIEVVEDEHSKKPKSKKHKKHKH